MEFRKTKNIIYNKKMIVIKLSRTQIKVYLNDNN